jgi:hypothetical protein
MKTRANALRHLGFLDRLSGGDVRFGETQYSNFHTGDENDDPMAQKQ